MLRKIFILLTFGVLSFLATQAQTPPPDDEDDAIPIDGGVSILLVAGLAYATKKVYDLRKN